MAASSIPMNRHPLHIDIQYEVETFQDFTWSDFPILQHSLIPFQSPCPPPLDLAKLKITKAVMAKTRKTVAKKAQKTSSKTVRFSSVTVQEHAVTVGIHDWCEGPLPITLDWKHTEPKSYDIDDFEGMRNMYGRMPRGRLPKLDYFQRRQRLRSVAGFTERDFVRFERGHSMSIYIELKRTKTITHFPPRCVERVKKPSDEIESDSYSSCSTKSNSYLEYEETS